MATIILILHLLSPFAFGLFLCYEHFKPLAFALGGIFVLCQIIGNGVCWLTLYENRLRGFSANAYPVIGLAFLVQMGVVQPNPTRKWLRTYSLVVGMIILSAAFLPPIIIAVRNQF